jgi:hypothetical protein
MVIVIRHVIVIGGVLVVEMVYFLLLYPSGYLEYQSSYVVALLLSILVTFASYPLALRIRRRVTSRRDRYVTILMLTWLSFVSIGLLAIFISGEASTPNDFTWVDALLLPYSVVGLYLFVGVMTSWIWIPTGLIAGFLLELTSIEE